MPTMIDSGEKVAIEVMRYYTLSKSRKLPKINALRSLRSKIYLLLINVNSCKNMYLF
ncbi:unnamed protein product [Acanthoscelides obtectus]|uniref:Uncharacterized protein n=1 Tax=Acanthoscelides obtectus TaxID=200917 RepID=A0A9P0KFF3_ACAOB|nr:unnamed protein product [Acanthoscelides obtectus]CAK1635035.1 hypothetical protein AOBTE_LOCUS9015 [Acanthoscelides obtectus]